MKRIIRLTESDLARLVRRVIKENEGNIKVKVGDIYKITNLDGTHVRFKITKEDNYGGDVSFVGIILGVFGKIEPDSDMRSYGYRDVKVGDPIELSFDEDGSGFSFYLPKTDGETESGGGNMNDLKKLN